MIYQRNIKMETEKLAARIKMLLTEPKILNQVCKIVLRQYKIWHSYHSEALVRRARICPTTKNKPVTISNIPCKHLHERVHSSDKITTKVISSSSVFSVSSVHNDHNKVESNPL